MLLGGEGYLKWVGPAVPGEAAWGSGGADTGALGSLLPLQGGTTLVLPTSILLIPVHRVRTKGHGRSVDLGRHQSSWPQMSIVFRAQSSSRYIEVPIKPHTADTVPALENLS